MVVSKFLCFSFKTKIRNSSLCSFVFGTTALILSTPPASEILEDFRIYPVYTDIGGFILFIQILEDLSCLYRYRRIYPVFKDIGGFILILQILEDLSCLYRYWRIYPVFTDVGGFILFIQILEDLSCLYRYRRDVFVLIHIGAWIVINFPSTTISRDPSINISIYITLLQSHISR